VNRPEFGRGWFHWVPGRVSCPSWARGAARGSARSAEPPAAGRQSPRSGLASLRPTRLLYRHDPPAG
jgi:hypothetical protein